VRECAPADHITEHVGVVAGQSVQRAFDEPIERTIGQHRPGRLPFPGGGQLFRAARSTCGDVDEGERVGVGPVCHSFARHFAARSEKATGTTDDRTDLRETMISP
jgi:hypothetical protein